MSNLSTSCVYLHDTPRRREDDGEDGDETENENKGNYDNYIFAPPKTKKKRK